MRAHKLIKVYTLIGPPAVGKSTWVDKAFMGKQRYLVSPDATKMTATRLFDLSYSELNARPKNEHDIEPRFGSIIESNKKLMYGDVYTANRMAQKLLYKAMRDAQKSTIPVVIDATNMTVRSRRFMCSKFMNERSENKNFRNIAVVFDVDMTDLDIILKIANERSQKGKYVPSNVITKALKSYEAPTLEEGFDNILHITPFFK